MGLLTDGGRSPPPTKGRLYRRIHGRLSDHPAFDNVRYSPSKIRPRTVLAEADPQLFVAPSYPVRQARFELEFLLQEPRPHYWIQWIEPDRGFACGWHQDQTHPEFGPCHVQVDYPDGSTERDRATVLDAHPIQVFETRLTELPELLSSIEVDQ